MKVYSNRSMTYFTLGILIGMSLMGLFAVTVLAADPVKPKKIENRMSLKQAWTIEEAGQGANKIRVEITSDPNGRTIRQLKQGKSDTMDRGEMVTRRVEKLRIIRPKVKAKDEPLTVDIKPKGKVK